MKKTFTGIVTSVAMKDTVVVEIFRQVPHPLYKKLLKRSKKYKVATEGQTVTVGDVVRIEETKPLSKDKHFRLAEIVTSVKEAKHA